MTQSATDMKTYTTNENSATLHGLVVEVLASR